MINLGLFFRYLKGRCHGNQFCAKMANSTPSSLWHSETEWDNAVYDLPPWLSGLAISGRGAVKAWFAIRQGVGSYPTPAGMSSQVSA